MRMPEQRPGGRFGREGTPPKGWSVARLLFPGTRDNIPRTVTSNVERCPTD